MKVSLILAAIAVSAQAGRKFNPKRTPKSMKGEHEPRYTIDAVTGEKEATNAINVAAELADGARELCIKEAQMFDEYCHQYKIEFDSEKTPRYADFTADGEGDCGFWGNIDDNLTHEGGHCLAQACMFDYCMYKRDEIFDGCNALAKGWEEEMAAQGVECKVEKHGVCLKTKGKVDYAGIETNMFKKVKKVLNKRPGWGQVYNYDNMHNELQSNNADGNFVS